MYLIYYLLSIILLMIAYILYNKNVSNKEEFLNYIQCERVPVSKRLDSIFENNNIKKDAKNWDLYLPCGYTYVESELDNIEKLKKNQKIFAIDGCDKIVSKYHLWKTLTNKLGDSYTNYFPKTYSFTKGDIKNLIANHTSGMKYIAKKDVQRQTGLTIIHKIKDLVGIMNDRKYLVIQELLNNPFLIDGRKINIRVYFLIVCNNGKVDGYVHDNGFIYYTADRFNYDSLSDKPHITTGYIDRSVYKKNPLTTDDLYVYLNKKGYKSETLKNNTINLFRIIMNALKIPICNSNKLKNGLAFQLFGCDVAPDNNLNVKLIELNKGPDLTAKDKRDDEVKREVTNDLLEIVDIIPKQNKENRFIKLT